MKYLLTLVCTLFLFASCSKDGGGEPPLPVKTERTVLVYMAGENNLTLYQGERYLYHDLQEMIEGSKQMKDNQRLFVFVDSLNTNSQQASNPFIMEIHGGKTYIRKQYTSEFYSCDPKRFREVVDWVIENGEADSYGLVLWGHANGWIVTNDSIEEGRAQSRDTRAYGQDNGTDMGGSVKLMNITQLARAMKGLPKMDFIFADCCNMMCAEVGYELREATEYLIGSPAEIPADGAPYNLMVPLFFKSDGENYRNMMNIYYDYYLDQNRLYYAPYSVPMSVIHTRYIGELMEATRDILERFTSPIPSYPEYLNLSSSDIAFYMYDDAPLMYDMLALVKTNTSETDFSKWNEIYRKAVPYYQMSMKWDTIYDNQQMAFSRFNPDISLYGCVSMFVPMNTSTYNNGSYHYNKTFKNYEWNRALKWERFGW